MKQLILDVEIEQTEENGWMLAAFPVGQEDIAFMSSCYETTKVRAFSRFLKGICRPQTKYWYMLK